MKMYQVVLFFCLLVFTALNFACSNEHNVKISSINDFGDELMSKYPVVEKLQIKLSLSQVKFVFIVNDNDVNYENSHLESIYEEFRLFLMSEDIQDDFIEKHNEIFKRETAIEDASNPKFYPDLMVSFKLNDDINSFYYDAEYYLLDLETKVNKVDKYQTWFGPYF